MSNIYNLNNTVLNLSSIRDVARRQFISMVQRLPGEKALVVDPQLIGALNVIMDLSTMKELVKDIFKLDESFVNSQDKYITYIYLTRPRVELMRIIARHLNNRVQAGLPPPSAPSAADAMPAGPRRFRFNLLFVPRRTLVCMRVLEAEGVVEKLDIDEYELDMIPLDDDVITMDMPTSFRDTYLNDDLSSLYYVSRALIRLQSAFGIIPRIKGKGPYSKYVFDMIDRMKAQLPPEVKNLPPEIDTLILLDRQTDFITPLLTQLTYEGLIDELYKIRNCILEIDLPSKGNANVKQATKVALNSNDGLFSTIRDLNWATVGPHLQKVALDVQGKYKERYNLQSVADMKEFVKKIPALQEENKSLANHINIAEALSKFTNDVAFRQRVFQEQSVIAGVDSEDFFDYVEECIAKKEPFLKVARLLCLYSVVNGGLKVKHYDFFRREILQTYGFESILTLHNLEKVGLLKGRADTKSTFPVLSKAFRLWNQNLDHNEQGELGYLYSGYSPLSVRLVQMAMQPGGWRARGEMLRSLVGGDFFEVDQPSAVPPNTSGEQKKKRVLVFFINGVTCAEISGLRYIGRDEEALQCEFIAASTSITTGREICDSMLERVGLLTQLEASVPAEAKALEQAKAAPPPAASAPAAGPSGGPRG